MKTSAFVSHPSKACTALIVCSVLLLLAAGPTSAAADDASDGYNLAVGLYKQSRWPLAAEKFQEYLRKHPDHAKAPYAKLYLGLTLINLEKYADARELLRGHVKDYPTSPNRSDALYRVAECSYLLNDLKAAEKELQAFLAHSPNSELGEWAWPYLGDTQLRLDDPTAAVGTFRQSLNRFPNGQLAEDSKFGLAKAYQALNRDDEAVALYRELAADRSSARGPQAQLNLGTLYFDRENYADAAAAFVRVEQQFPQSRLVPTAQLNAGYAYYQLGEYQAAVALFEKAARQESQSATAGFWKGVSLKSLGDYAQAAAVLKAAYEADANNPLAERTLFQWADCQLRNKQYDEARRQFLELVRRWPDGDLADDSLHYAGEAALLADRLDEAGDLLERFGREYPGSGLRMHHELLQGRLRRAQGGEDNLKRAAAHFQKVLAETSVPRTQSLARLYLGQTWHKLGDSAQAIAAVAPLVEQIGRDGTASEFTEALVLQGLCLLDQKDFAAAVAALSRYLELEPQGGQADQALAARALAEAQQGNAAKAKFNLATLSSTFPQSPLIARTIHELAEIAYAESRWDAAEELFVSLTALGDESPYHAKGLSGLAWTLYQKKNYAEAAQGFARLVRQHPDDALASEAAYMRGKALEEAGQTQQAADAYAQAFRTFAPQMPNSAAADEGLAKHVYLAGLQSARMLKALKKTDEADAAYDALQKQFRRGKDRDKLLEEWALLNYEAERFNRSDAIFRQLIDETPDSDRADNARLSLAESDLVGGRLDQAAQAFRDLAADPQAGGDVRQVALYHLIGIAADRADWRESLKAADQLTERYPDSNFRWHARFYSGEAHLQLGDLEKARDAFLALKTSAEESAVSRSEWFPRVWVLLAETYFRLKQYADVEATVDELRSRDPMSRYLYQADEVLGRSYKNQAKFDPARTAFQRVIDNPHGRRTETAAKSQLMIAETHLIQRNYKQALEDYLKVHILYKFPEWQSLAVYQAARCHESLNEWPAAVNTYEMLLKEFPNSEKAAEAQQRLAAARKRAGNE
jgi:cellulose synthase operon protein C